MKKFRRHKSRWVRLVPYFFLGLFLFIGLRLMVAPTTQHHAPSVRVAVKDLTQVQRETSPKVSKPLADDGASVSIDAVPMDLLSPVKPNLRVTVKDLGAPPVVLPNDQPEEEAEAEPAYEEKAAAPESPAGATPRGVSGRPRIALIIDDVGLHPNDAERLRNLPPQVTYSFLPYAVNLQLQANRARAGGHPLMLHLPMQPMGKDNPGQDALLTNLSEEENLTRLKHALDSFKGYEGINNHMGSKFTSDTAAMTPVLKAIAARHLFFVDSRTSGQTVAAKIAEDIKLPHVSRDVFIDDDQKPSAIEAQLAKIEKVARSKGHAVAIGHPHTETIQQMESWVKELHDKGFDLVPVKELVKP